MEEAIFVRIPFQETDPLKRSQNVLQQNSLQDMRFMFLMSHRIRKGDRIKSYVNTDLQNEILFFASSVRCREDSVVSTKGIKFAPEFFQFVHSTTKSNLRYAAWVHFGKQELLVFTNTSHVRQRPIRKTTPSPNLEQWSVIRIFVELSFNIRSSKIKNGKTMPLAKRT